VAVRELVCPITGAGVHIYVKNVPIKILKKNVKNAKNVTKIKKTFVNAE